jgi:diguanylate cyclase (GGDEF)-like protein
VVGAVSLGWLTGWFIVGAGALENWEIGVVLIALASIAQVFVVLRLGSNYSDHLTPAPFFAAMLLLPSPLVAILVCASFLPEWLWYRRAWPNQLFNIAAWLIALSAGRFTLYQLAGHARFTGDFRFPTWVILASLLVVLVVQTGLFAGLFMVTHRQSLGATGLVAPQKLFVEFSLLCLGWGLAAAWLVDPTYGLAALVPLVLIFQGLQVPNLKEEASTDSKTGLANMRHFNYMLERELERARRSGQPISILMADVDYLRNINNTYGHQAGDVVLRVIAETIQSQVRASDLPGRFGGEEFCIFLTDTPIGGARVAAERIRRVIEQTAFPIGRNNHFVGVTMSLGVAAFPRDGQTSEAVMHEADLAVYQAKRDGRNRVVVAGRESRELAALWAQENLISHVRPRPRVSANPLRRFVGEATGSIFADTVVAQNVERSSSAPTDRS